MVAYSNKSALDFVRSVQGFSSDGLADEYAAQHLVDGTPAFGRSCQYSNQRAGLFCGTVARLGNINAAIEELTPFFTMHGGAFDPYPLLDYLLPLNPAAVRNLKMAYEDDGRRISTEELEARTENYRVRAA